ncbi:integrase [Pseudomonas sp. PB101]|uniref:integrase n=1 Tax=Pseudomonas sp. PB101 TaxID=2495428 RepID=UPI001365AF7C|nr:integrase [Pseudomonas sp. PB101]MVW84785.1 integrase [Pseudomonas sp. PB101]
MHLPPEISFLKPFLIEAKDTYRTAVWLKSDFDAPIWAYNFDSKESSTLDWNIILDDGSLLTSKENSDLLNSFKFFLTASTRSVAGYMSETNDLGGQQRTRFRQALLIIDCFLQNADRYGLTTYGLGGLTAGNLREILEQIASNSLTSESIYNWTKELQIYCLKSYECADKAAIQMALQMLPQLSIITPEQEENDELGIPHQMIPSVRAALHLKNLYINHKSHGKVPNSIAISQDIYRRCLWGKNNAKPVHEILCIQNNISQFTREYQGIKVTTGTPQKIQYQEYCGYRTVLYNIGALHEVGLPAPPIDALMEIERLELDLSTTGRHRTLPSTLVFKCLRQAIEFHLEHGEKLRKGLCRLALYCKINKTRPTKLTNEKAIEVLGSELVKIGVRQLGLSCRNLDSGKSNRSIKGEKTEYFNKLRSNSGFLDLIGVYIGSVQLVVGVLMARRVTEMCGLQSNSCFDDSEQWLLFYNGKSTRSLFGLRRRVARPIEPIAVEMIKNLIHMQKVLVRIGYIDNMMTLFATPSFKGINSLTNASLTSYNRNLDLLCDYFETPLNHLNQRYYIRQHQLRRFFAMLFFYCGSFAKLDTLQWMLGHGDIKHVWHYITETTDGAVLESAKAHYVAESMQGENIQYFTDLANLIKKRYGTEDFSLLDTNDLEDHILDLIQQGLVDIQPEFFTDETGEQFKIVAKVSRGTL